MVRKRVLPHGYVLICQVVHDTRGPAGTAAPLEFNTGMDEVPEAVDMAVRLMTPGETSLVRASPRYAFDGRADRPEVLHFSCFSGGNKG